MVTSRQRRSVTIAFVLATLALGVPWISAESGNPAATMAKAANSWLASLSPEQRQQASFAFEAEARTEWHFVPKDRAGLMIKSMSPSQRKLAHRLLQTGLSATGYKKTTEIMSLERVLAQMENNPDRRDPEKYYFSIFGTPGANETWGWKAEGHHVSLNFTVLKGNVIASTPLFLGANPGEVREGSRKGVKVLAKEEEEGRRFLMSLSETQRKRAIFDQTAPPEIVTGSASQADKLNPVGLSVADMNATQARALMALVKLYAATVSPPLAAARLARLESLKGKERLTFGWAGGIEPGAPHYYRIAGPSFVVEYDNTQNEANHVHTVWRDYDNDFGRDLLRQHLMKDHR